MPSRNTIEIVINAKDNASQVFDQLANNTNKIGTLATGALVAGFGVATAAVTGFATKGISEFMKFEQGMQEVFSLLPGITQDAMDSMIDKVEYMSQRFGVLPEKTIPALYEALSAGIPQDNVFQFLEVANKAAIAGVTDLATATNGISSAMNAYGHDILEAGKASDIMFQTVKLGKTTFEELSNSLYNVSPTAASLGVTFEDLNAQIAAITAQGTPTSVATNQMRQMFVELSKAGGKTAETFQQLAGKTFKQFIAEGGNTQDALQLLEKHAKDTGIGINDLFSSVEAGSAALSLTGQNTGRFTNFLEEMSNAAGSTDLAFETMSKSIQFQVNRLNAKMSILYKTIGEKLAPVVAPLVEGLGDVVSIIIDLVDGTTDWTDAIQENNPFLRKIMENVLKFGLGVRKVVYEVVNLIKAVMAGVNPLNAFFTTMMNFGVSTNVGLAIMGIISALADLKGILEFITTPIKAFIRDNVKLQDVLIALGFAISTVVLPALLTLVSATLPIVGTFALLVAGAVLLRKAWDKNFLGIRDRVSKAVVFIETKLTDLRAALWNTFGDPGDDPVQVFIDKFKNLSFVQGLLDRFSQLKTTVVPLFREIGNALKNINFGQLFEIGTTLISLTNPLGIIKTLFETIFNVNIFDLFIEGISKVTELLFNLNNGKPLLEALGIKEESEIGQIINTIVGYFQGFVSFVQSTVIPGLQRLGNWFLEDVLPRVVTFVSSVVIPAISSFFSWLANAWNTIRPGLESLANWFINDALPAIINFINNTVIPAFQGVVRILVDVWNAVSPSLTRFANWFIQDILPQVVTFINQTFLPTIQSIMDIIGQIWTFVQPYLQQFYDWFMTSGLPAISEFITGTVMVGIQNFINLLAGIWESVKVGVNALKTNLQSIFNWIRTNIIDPVVARINELKATLQSLGITTGGGFNAQTAAQNAASQYSSMYGSGNNITSGGNFGVGSFNGMAFVPRDNMPVRLHRGERVLTAQENQQYSGGNQKPTVVIENISIGNITNQTDANAKASMFVDGLRAKGIDI